MTKTDAYQQAAALIEKATNILITTHTKPDGDACGCVGALTRVLRQQGKAVVPVLMSAIPDWYRFLLDGEVSLLEKDEQVDRLIAGEFGVFDLIVIVDTNSYTQLPHFERYLKQAMAPVLIIDHHVTSDNLGDVELVDTTAAAAGLVTYDFLDYAGWPLDPKTAEALFVAIATDTGWFQFNNTDSRTYRRFRRSDRSGRRAGPGLR